MNDSEILARVCAAAADEKKAESITLLDLRPINGFTDFFVICSGTSEPQLKAITSSIRENVRKQLGLRPLAADGIPGSQWMVLDYGGVIVHVFLEEMRTFYDLENLWSDATRSEWVE